MSEDEDWVAGENYLRGIDPERLLNIEPEEIKALLEFHYPALFARSEELRGNAIRWLDEHKSITSEADNAAASALYTQLRDYAGAGKELDETRKKVKSLPFRACTKIDEVFGTYGHPITRIMEYITTIQQAYGLKKAADEREARRRAAEEARQAAEAAAALARAMPDDDQRMDSAVMAEVEAMEAEKRASAPLSELTRTQSALGITTTGTSIWKYEVTDIKALCRAVADGKVDASFVVPNDIVILAAIRKKKGAIRECAGLNIYEDIGIRRRSA